MLAKTASAVDSATNFVLSTLKSLLMMIVVAVIGLVGAIVAGIALIDVFVG